MDEMTPEELENLDENSIGMQRSVLDMPEAVPDAVKKNIFRDYSQVLKAIEKKKTGAGGYRP